MLKNSFFTFLTIGTALLYGCSFSTQTINKSPHFSGTVKYSREPVQNARIMLSLDADDSFCVNAKYFTNTDDQGQFNLNAAKEKSTYTPFVNYSMNEWSVCIKYNNQIYPLYSNNKYSQNDINESITLDCDLALKPYNHPCTVNHIF